MNNRLLPFFAFLLMSMGLFAYSAAFVVGETQQVVITRFGKPIGEPIRDAGLHFKMPMIDKANFFEKRILEWDGRPREIPTKDKKFIWVDTTGRWRIADPLKFLLTMGSEEQAHSRLNDLINGASRDLISGYELVEIVRSSNRILDVKGLEEFGEQFEYKESISVGREKITREILEKAKTALAGFGIELIDVRIKRLNYVDRVRRKVYERMISERKRAAELLRSEGQGKSAEIEGRKERDLKQIQSDAYRKAQEMTGKADAEAARIYAEAYNKDPEFYQFMKTLELYPETLKDSSLVFSTGIEYLKYFHSPAEKETKPAA